MNKKGFSAILIVFLVLILIGLGFFYYVFMYPRSQLKKARTSDTTIQTNTDTLLVRNEIEEKGYNSTINISPSQNDVVFGTVTVTGLNLPEETKHVGFAISESFDTLGSGGPNLGFDSDGSDGWNFSFNTTEYENGVYYLALFAFQDDSTSNPIGVTNVQLEIRN